MAEGSFKRKLAAVFSADVKGYSRLMGEDEAATVRTLEIYKGVMSELIRQHRGRVVDSPGDNVLAEFASVVDAVQCGVAVQKELEARNAELPENRRMQFRIGINLGDVIEEEGRIYGDGVNIAARLEALADPGGICVSKTAFDHIETKLPLGYEFLGEQEVKNIAKPIGAYKVLMEPRVIVKAKAKAEGVGRKAQSAKRKAYVLGAAAVVVLIGVAAVWQFVISPKPPPVEKADPNKMALPLPDKPSIAVLPFVNMSGDPQQDYFSDGLTEEIIAALSKSPKLFVIARNSTFTYKGKPVKVQEVSEALGVRYVLEGSVRWAGDKVRITAQLIDALTGNHLWSERYEKPIGEIFAVQDEITLAIIRGMRVSLTEGEQARLIGKGTKNLDAYLKAIQANEQFLMMNRQGSIKAQEFAREAMALDPKYAFPYAVMANAHMLDVWFRFSESPEESMRLAEESAHKALALDDGDPSIRTALTNLYVMQRQHDKAIASAERALELGPGAARSQHGMGIALAFACRFNAAIPFFEEAIRLDPYPPSTSFRSLASAYSAVRRHDEALKLYEKALQMNPNDIFAHLALAGLLVELGREEEARAEAREVLRIHSKFSLDHFARTLTYKDQAFVDRRIELLRKAGLK
jgi:adenylate cyclase